MIILICWYVVLGKSFKYYIVVIGSFEIDFNFFSRKKCKLLRFLVDAIRLEPLAVNGISIKGVG